MIMTIHTIVCKFHGRNEPLIDHSRKQESNENDDN